MKVLYFIDKFSEDYVISDVVEYENKLWLVSPIALELDEQGVSPVRLIRLDSLPKFWENTQGYYVLNTVIPRHILSGAPEQKTTIEYEVLVLQDISVCNKPRSGFH